MKQTKMQIAELGVLENKLRRTQPDFGNLNHSVSPVRAQRRMPIKKSKKMRKQKSLETCPKEDHEPGEQKFNYLVISQHGSSVGDNSEPGDVATLGKLSIDGERFTSSQHNDLSNNNYQTTLSVRKNVHQDHLADEQPASEITVYNMVEPEPKAMFPKRAVQQNAASRWKSPFKAHLERSYAQKQMLEFNASRQPSEVLHKSNNGLSEEKAGESSAREIVMQNNKQPRFSSVVHWHDSGLPGPGSLVYNLDPFDKNSSSQARDDSAYSMTLLVGQPIVAPSQERDQSAENSPDGKKNSCDQTESRSDIENMDGDYGQRNRTAEEIARREPIETLQTPATELRKEASFNKTDVLDPALSRLQNIHSYERFEAKNN